MNDIQIESFGITKSPLDAYRGTGRWSGVKDNNAPLSIKQKEQRWAYYLDIAGNNVPVPLKEGVDYEMLPTITKKVELSEMELEKLIEAGRSLSPCPCKSIECDEYYKKEKVKFETLMTQKEPTLSHASGIHLFRGNNK